MNLQRCQKKPEDLVDNSTDWNLEETADGAQISALKKSLPCQKSEFRHVLDWFVDKICWLFRRDPLSNESTEVPKEAWRSCGYFNRLKSRRNCQWRSEFSIEKVTSLSKVRNPPGLLFDIGEILWLVTKSLDLKDFICSGEPLATIWLYLRHYMVPKSKLFWTKFHSRKILFPTF